MPRNHVHRADYDRNAILERLMAKPVQQSTPKRSVRSSDGTVSFKQAITVKACADALGDDFAWVDKPRKGRYVISLNGETLTPAEVSTIIDAWKARPR